MNYYYYFLLILFILFELILTLSQHNQKIILKCHNNYRSILAKGKSKNKQGNNMPSASNMNLIKYSKVLEFSAKEWAEKCLIKHSNGIYGENLFMSTNKKLTDSSALLQACKDWWSELKNYGIDNQNLILNNKQFSKGIGHWSQMAWANTLEIGCARSFCPNSEWKTFIVCQYNPPGNYLNQLIYNEGKPCNECNKCDHKKGFCL